MIMIFRVNILSEYLALVFQSPFIHGYLPNKILLANLQPIIKNKVGSKSSSPNYGDTGISSLILKILHLLFLDICQDALSVSEQQFGFQKNCSTTLCIFTIKETIELLFK